MINNWEKLREAYNDLFSPILSNEELEMIIKPIDSCYLEEISLGIFHPRVTSKNNILFLTNRRIGIGVPVYKTLTKKRGWAFFTYEEKVGEKLVGYKLGNILTEYSNIKRVKVLKEGDAEEILSLYFYIFYPSKSKIEILEDDKDRLLLIIFKKSPLIHQYWYGDIPYRVLFIPPEAQSYTEKEIKTITAREIRDIINKKYQQNIKEEKKHETVTYKVDVNAILKEFKITETGLLIGRCPYCSAENPLEKGGLSICRYCGKRYIVPNKILELL